MSDSGDTYNEISGSGQQFGALVQARDVGSVTFQLPVQIPAAMFGIPPKSAAFSGRHSDLRVLLDCLAPCSEGQDPAVVAVVAVGGMAGIGKTELAVQAAHAAVAKDWFPGGVLFVDMFGYNPDPARRLEPNHALSVFLRALGVPNERIPSSVQERAQLFRSELAARAEQGRRVLVVVDNVSDANQARPLLPADGVNAAIVTSRHKLADLDARLVNLDVLSAQDAIGLLRQVLVRRDPADTRVADHPGDAQKLAMLCGGLPLALQIVAALLAENSVRPLAAMVSDLADSATRLEEMSYADRTVRAVFDLSYDCLDANHALLYRLLSLNPGPDISTSSVAALSGMSEVETRRGLEVLARAHLIEPSVVYGRWGMHDLIQLHSAYHGRTCASPDQRAEAFAKLLHHYLTTTRAANVALGSTVADPAVVGFDDRKQALEWLDIEFSNLTAATLTAATNPGHLTIARDLPAEMQHFLSWRRHLADWIILSKTALAAAQDLGDKRGQAVALNSRGIALWETRRFDESIVAHADALQIFREIDDHHGEGAVLGNLGLSQWQKWRFDEAITTHFKALQIFHETGDRHGEGKALNNLGLALREKRLLDGAMAAHTEALKIFCEISDKYGEAVAHGNIGLVFLVQGHLAKGAAAAHRGDTAQGYYDPEYGEGQALPIFESSNRFKNEAAESKSS